MPNASLSVSVRKAMKDSGLTDYRLSKMTGLAETTLSRFRANQNDLLLTNAGKLMGALGIKVSMPPRVTKGTTNAPKAKG